MAADELGALLFLGGQEVVVLGPFVGVFEDVSSGVDFDDHFIHGLRGKKFDG